MRTTVAALFSNSDDATIRWRGGFFYPHPHNAKPLWLARLGILLALLSQTACAEQANNYEIADNLVHGDELRQLVVRTSAKVSSPWGSHGIQVKDQRFKPLVAHWRLLDDAPFLASDRVQAGEWTERDLLQEELLPDGRLIDGWQRVTEPGLIAEGLIDHAECAGAEPQRVAYDRARTEFLVLCEASVRAFKLGDPSPVSGALNISELQEFIDSDAWRPGRRLALVGGMLVTWKGLELTAGRTLDFSLFHVVTVVDLAGGTITRPTPQMPDSARILDIAAGRDGGIELLLCSKRGKAGWKLALLASGAEIAPIQVPERFKGCSPHDNLLWIPERNIVVFPEPATEFGVLTIAASNYRSGAHTQVTWKLQ